MDILRRILRLHYIVIHEMDVFSIRSVPTRLCGFVVYCITIAVYCLYLRPIANFLGPDSLL